MTSIRLALILLLAASPAVAQSTGGPYRLDGTIGRSAGGPLSGGAYGLRGDVEPVAGGPSSGGTFAVTGGTLAQSPGSRYIILTQSGGSTEVTEGGAADSYTLTASAAPDGGSVQVQAWAGAQVEVSADNVSFGSTAIVTLVDTAPVTVYVRAIDDDVFEGPHADNVTHIVTTSSDPAFSNVLTPVPAVTVRITDNDVKLTTINQIQGPGAVSPIVGTEVNTRGVVTALKSDGFFIQVPDAMVDGDPLTSEGLFVFTSAPPAVSPGDYVQVVSGLVSEFVPPTDPNQPPFTALSGSLQVTIRSSGNPLPAPVVITAESTTAPDAVTRLESLEGMRVSVPSLIVAGPTTGSVNESTATSTSRGIFYGVVPGLARPFREAGIDVTDPLPAGSPCCVPRWDGNPERLGVDSAAQPGTVPLDLTTGVAVNGIVGPLDYRDRTYTVVADAGSASATTPNATFWAVPPPRADDVTVSGFSLGRFFDTVDDPSTSDAVLTASAFDDRVNKAALAIRTVLLLPDVLGVSEVENLATLQALATRINDDVVAAGGASPAYAAYLEEGNDSDGLDVGFLVKSSRVTVLNVRQEGRDATFSDPTDSSTYLLNDRPPLVLDARTLRAKGVTFDFSVVMNHLGSRDGIDDPVNGVRIREQRRAQAEYLATLLQTMQTASPGARVLAVGDFNAFELNDGYVDSLGTIVGAPAPASDVVLASGDLVNPDLTDLSALLPASERYSTVTLGNAELRDHAVATEGMLPWVSRFSYARFDADFPDTMRNDPTRPERVSEHDASMAYLALGVPRILSKLLSTGPQPPGQTIIAFEIRNVGGGNASNATLNQVVLQRLSGSGTVTLLTPVPIALGDLAAGESLVVTLTLNVPATVSRFSITGTGSFSDAGGTADSFTIDERIAVAKPKGK